MEQCFKNLEEKFVLIRNKGWIKTMRKGSTGIGYTFEQLLGKEEEQFPYSDYNGIEIKTRRKFSAYGINLFNLAPDGNFIFYKERLLKYFGYPDKINKKYKVFNMGLKTNRITNIGYYKIAKAIVDREKKEVRIEGYNNYGQKLDVDISWSFSLLEERFNLKLNYLAIILANTMKYNGYEFFKYDKISFYKYKGFNAFLKLMEESLITIVFKIGVYRSGEKKGRICDHGISFCISYDNIEKLFYRIKNDY